MAAINAVNNIQPVARQDAGCGQRFRSACSRIGKVAKDAMQLPVRQAVGNAFTKTRQFSKGLIAKALGTAVKGIAIDATAFAVGGKAAEALATQAGSLVPYSTPIAVAATAGAVAYKSKSPKARLMAGAICLTALATTIYVAFSSSEKREELASNLQSMGVFLGIKAGQILGSFATQRYLLGTKVNRYEASKPDFYGNTKQVVADSYPIRLVDFEQPNQSYALRMGQYFLAREFLPVCVSGESPLRDKLIPLLSYNAAPLSEMYVAFQEGRKKGLQGKLLTYAQNFIGDPAQYAEKLANSLTAASPFAKQSPLAKVFGLLTAQVNNKALKPVLRKIIHKIASDLPGFVQVAMRTLSPVASVLKDGRVIEACDALRNTYQFAAQDEPNPAGIQAAKIKLNDTFLNVLCEDERYVSLLLFDKPITKMVDGLANYLADLLIHGDDQTFAGLSNLAEVYLGFPLEDLLGTAAAGVNVENFRRDYLAVFLKFYMMAIVVNYPTMKRGLLDSTEEFLFLDGVSTMFAEVKPLPLPNSAQEVVGSVVGKMAKVGNVLRSKETLPPPVPAKRQGRFSQFVSSIGSIIALVCKAAFRVLCKGVGALRKFVR